MRRRTALVVVALGALALAAALHVVPARADAPVQVAIGATAVCALTEAGEIDCWGFDIPLVRDVPQGAFSDVSLGPNDACAISTEGSAVCWGVNYAGLQARIDRLLARDPDTDLHFFGLAQFLPSDRTDLVQIVVHPWRQYACALTAQGEIVCWGELRPHRPSPSESGFVHLISTGREFCALDSEGSTTCWGDMTFDDFVSDAGPFVRIVASGNGLCGVTAEEEVRCRTYRSRTAPGPPQPHTQVFRNVHVLGSQGCAIIEDGSIQCRQAFHWCYNVIPPEIDYCPPHLIRFQYWAIPFTILYEGGPDREAAAAHSYTHLFGDQAACAITTEAHILCWSDFRRGDPRLQVPERFRPQLESTEPEPPADSDDRQLPQPPT